MDVNNEILDAIEIMVSRAMKNSAAIYICRVVSVNADKTCVVAANGGEYTVKYFGTMPQINSAQPLFVPYSNISKAFLITGGASTVEPSISAPIIGIDFEWTGGDGTYQVLEDGKGNWRIKFLSSGTFTPLKNMVVDAFLVGAGGGSGSLYCGSGGAGYTITVRSVVLAANTAYSIGVGVAGINGNNSTDGGASSAFSASAAGGKRSANGTSSSIKSGGNGGSGGGGGSGGYGKAAGGTDGSDGTDSASKGGTGQGTTTREFGEVDGDLYASGGGNNLTATIPNSGNGGTYNVEPADGIVVIRKHKDVTA
jgi:hypothetical protein